MQRLDSLRQKVDELYKANNSNADVWIDWGYKNHVLVVAELSEKIATQYKANVEFCVAGALLHDIADAVMSRWSPDHEQESLSIAKRLLRENSFSEDEVSFIIDEVIKPHGCKEISPTKLEGKVLATADGAAHFITDFYPLFCWRHYGPKDDYGTFRDWVSKKIEKDYTKKFFFDEVKKEITPKYEAVRMLFGNDVSYTRERH